MSRMKGVRGVTYDHAWWLVMTDLGDRKIHPTHEPEGHFFTFWMNTPLGMTDQVFRRTTFDWS